MEKKIRDAFRLANELTGKAEGVRREIVFNLVFNAMLAGTTASPADNRTAAAIQAAEEEKPDDTR